MDNVKCPVVVGVYSKNDACRELIATQLGVSLSLPVFRLDGHLEYIASIVLDMTPEYLRAHRQEQTEYLEWLRNALRRSRKLFLHHAMRRKQEYVEPCIISDLRHIEDVEEVVSRKGIVVLVHDGYADLVCELFGYSNQAVVVYSREYSINTISKCVKNMYDVRLADMVLGNVDRAYERQEGTLNTFRVEAFIESITATGGHKKS